MSIYTFAIGDTVEIGPAFRMGGTLHHDSTTGWRGPILSFTPDGDAELDCARGTVWVFRDRLRPVDRSGAAGTSHNDRTYGGENSLDRARF